MECLWPHLSVVMWCNKRWVLHFHLNTRKDVGTCDISLFMLAANLALNDSHTIASRNCRTPRAYFTYQHFILIIKDIVILVDSKHWYQVLVISVSAGFQYIYQMFSEGSMISFILCYVVHVWDICTSSSSLCLACLLWCSKRSPTFSCLVLSLLWHCSLTFILSSFWILNYSVCRNIWRLIYQKLPIKSTFAMKSLRIPSCLWKSHA